MAMNNIISITCLLFLLLLSLSSCTNNNNNQVYLVEFGEHNNGEKTLNEIESTHHSYLLLVKENEDEAKASLVYSYKHTFNGFAAYLTPNEANNLSGMEGVVSVRKSQTRIYSLHTTRSWKFVGLDGPFDPLEENSNETNRDLLAKAKYGQDIIVGMVDSGVWPDSKSFSDKGMGPVPKKWKGVCTNGTDFGSSKCNRCQEATSLKVGGGFGGQANQISYRVGDLQFASRYIYSLFGKVQKPFSLKLQIPTLYGQKHFLCV